MPHDADVLQILWCPCMHDHHQPRSMPLNGMNGAPWVQVRFHRRADGLVPFTPPEPLVIGYRHLLPEPCVLDPEPVAEYPLASALEPGLAERILAWNRTTYDPDGEREDRRHTYDHCFAIAPGWRLGGHPYRHVDEPAHTFNCPCGAEMRHLATVPSKEWDAGTDTWAPEHDTAGTAGTGTIRHEQNPTMVRVGNSQTMRIFTCPTAPDHPVHAEIVF